jgi:hypothetical protein
MSSAAHDLSHLFSADYATARQRFRDCASRAGATIHSLPLDAKGPHGEELTIDIAWLGDRAAKRILLHTSGLHGVEAYAGSAVQLAFLRGPPLLDADSACVLVHVLNPYGMAWLRRANENNVDLNRNFLPDGESWSGAPEIYRLIDHVLNPQSPPRSDFFYAKALWQTWRHGFGPLKQAVAQGQYEFPRGLFFGGHALERGPRLYLSWLADNLPNARYVFAIDLHTGLGRWGKDTLLLEAGRGATATDALESVLSRPLVDVRAKSSVAYEVRGGLGAILPHALPGLAIDFILQEIGTYPPLAVFHALREENRWHHYGAGTLEHPTKRRLAEHLCPASRNWRASALNLGTSLMQRAAAWVSTTPRAG